jgi:hypothetical protein
LPPALFDFARRTLAPDLAATARSSRIARKLLLERGQTFADRGFDLDQFLTRPERCLARVGANLRAVDRDLGQPHKPFANQRRHALRQQPIENVHLLNPEVGKPVIIQRHAAREPTIGGVARRKSLQFARPNPPLRSSHRATAKAEPQDRRPAAPPSRERTCP